MVRCSGGPRDESKSASGRRRDRAQEFGGLGRVLRLGRGARALSWTVLDRRLGPPLRLCRGLAVRFACRRMLASGSYDRCVFGSGPGVAPAPALGLGRVAAMRRRRDLACFGHDLGICRGRRTWCGACTVGSPWRRRLGGGLVRTRRGLSARAVGVAEDRQPEHSERPDPDFAAPKARLPLAPVLLETRIKTPLARHFGHGFLAALGFEQPGAAGLWGRGRMVRKAKLNERRDPRRSADSSSTEGCSPLSGRKDGSAPKDR